MKFDRTTTLFISVKIWGLKVGKIKEFGKIKGSKVLVKLNHLKVW
jgi:hypothetical protein